MLNVWTHKGDSLCAIVVGKQIEIRTVGDKWVVDVDGTTNCLETSDKDYAMSVQGLTAAILAHAMKSPHAA